ncbi:D-ribose pyranase [Variovorax sp. YR750]|uniref:D-ribose pyranase n=1 Tax=Variovorax sp. YR750 TaxID=1884384 RepID=UPI0008D3D157|nr:D-ribose pyranase [Variovorax sp. YR750]MDP9605837.1 D-ribose pyranase [Variovorax paradoxus]SEL98324.1 D-ribose pyranase [Variovorax sp. YR750]
MKRSPLLHAELSHVIASLGHGDMLVLGDAGLPIPDGPRRIDLAVARGVPLLDDVLQAVLSEMQVEGIVVADEALGDAKKLPGWYPQSLGIEPQTVSHEEFKRRTAKARAMVRTGECTPYANIILIAGVAF